MITVGYEPDGRICNGSDQVEKSLANKDNIDAGGSSLICRKVGVVWMVL
jgi:hypothetical protein